MSNMVTLVGKVNTNLTYTHCRGSEKFYVFILASCRKSGVDDLIPIIISDHILNATTLCVGEIVAVNGEFRSHNSYDHNKVHLMLDVLCNRVEPLNSTEAVNDAFLDGIIAKEPTLRVTPMGRELSDFQLDVKRHYNKYDHIPCVAWGKTAEYISTLPAGAYVRVSGRVQSRDYVKNGMVHTAYELSVNLVEVVSY